MCPSTVVKCQWSDRVCELSKFTVSEKNYAILLFSPSCCTNMFFFQLSFTYSPTHVLTYTEVLSSLKDVCSMKSWKTMKWALRGTLAIWGSSANRKYWLSWAANRKAVRGASANHTPAAIAEGNLVFQTVNLTDQTSRWFQSCDLMLLDPMNMLFKRLTF